MIYERRSALSANVIDVRGKRRTTFVSSSDDVGFWRWLPIVLGVIYLKVGALIETALIFGSTCMSIYVILNSRYTKSRKLFDRFVVKLTTEMALE